MGRAPCCDRKQGLKKGPWKPEEDKLLVDYIQANGHGSWRLLPKLAGLLDLISFDSSSSNQALLSLRRNDVIIVVLVFSSSAASRVRLVLSGLIQRIGICMDACRAEPVRQELPAAVGELPPAGHQARAVHRRGAEVRRPAPRHRRKQVRPPTSFSIHVRTRFPHRGCTAPLVHPALELARTASSVERAIVAKNSRIE
jgi:hypothetical protein